MAFLEEFAEKHNAAVIATSQWNRETFKRKDQKQNSRAIAGSTGSAKVEYCSANLFSIAWDPDTKIRTVTAEKIKDGAEGSGAAFYLRHDRPRAMFESENAEQVEADFAAAERRALEEKKAEVCRVLRRLRDTGSSKDYPPST